MVHYRYVRALYGLALLLALGGCVASGPLAVLPTVAPDDAAQIVVVRPWGFTAALSTVVITLDGLPVWGLDNDEHIRLSVPPGEHIIGVRFGAGGNPTVTLQTERRRTYYLRVYFDASGHIARKTEAEGLDDVKETTLAQ